MCYNELGGSMYSNELVCNVIEYLNNNINKDITITELSTLFYFDKTYMMKRFKRELGISIFDYINTIKIYNSLLFFRDDNYFLSIAFKNGFNSQEYFSETFKKIIGVKPMTYKKYIRYFKISKKDEDTILFNINRITNIKNRALEYIRHRKPKTNPVKVIKL